MNRKELVQKISDQLGMKKCETDEFVVEALSTIKQSLIDGERVQLVGFGTFEVHRWAARRYRNPQTMEYVTNEARNLPIFKPGKAFKELVN